MAMLNLISIGYICFRLAPFILVCILSLTSILYQDFKGIIYIAGLLITSVIAILLGPFFKSPVQTPNVVCKLITLTDSGPLSNIPLSIITFTYTSAYLGYIIFKYKLASQNIPSLVIFPLLIISDILWQMSNGCSTIFEILGAIIIGIVGGMSWAAIIDSVKNTNLMYFNGISNAQSCSRPSVQSFKCVNSRDVNKKNKKKNKT